jgi:hypothetical protein
MKMSDVDVLIESTISEAPVGMISRGVKKLLGKLPGDIGDKATGQLQVGEFANQLKKDYSYFLGKTGYERSRESLKVFLDQTGLSDAALDTAISSTTGGSSSNQDWKIYPGRAQGGPVNRAIDPVVDIGSATDADAQEVPSLDDPIAAARQKRIDATARAQQQAKAGNKPTATPDKSTGTSYSAADIAANKATQAAVSGAGTPSDKSASIENPTGSELPPPPPEDTDNNSASNFYGIDPEKLREYVQHKLDSNKALKNKTVTDADLSKYADLLHDRAIGSIKHGYLAAFIDPKNPAEVANPLINQDIRLRHELVSDILRSMGYSVGEPVGDKKSGTYSATITKDSGSAPQANTPAKSTSATVGDTTKKVKQPSTTQIGEERKDAVAQLKDNTEVQAAFKKANSLIGQYSLTKKAELKPEVEKAIAELDTAIAKNQNTAPSSKAPGLKPVDPNSLSGKLSTAIASKKNPTAQQGQMELPGYEPGGVASQEQPEEQDDTSPEADSNQLDIHDVKAKAKPKKKVSLGDETKTVKAKAKSPKAADTEKEEKPVEKKEPKAEPKAAKTTTDEVKKRGADLVAAVNAYNKDKSDEDLKHAVAVARLKYEKAQKEAEADEEDATPSTSSFGSELGKMASRMSTASTKKSSSEEEPTPATDDEDAWMDQEPMPKAKKAKAAKNKKMALAASIEHEFDYLLAEDELTNKQVDKILLAVAQDNVRKNIVDLGRRPTTSKKPATQPSGRSSGSSSSSSSAPSYSSGSTGSSQYTQQGQQKSGGKTLDLSDFNVERLISAINHILKKEELQRFEERQLEKLMRELKAVREGRAMQEANMLTEAPMGLGQRLATGVASKFSTQAAGKLDVGKIANQYKPEYSRWLGTTGANPDAQSLIDFFQSKRLDTSKIQQIADSVAPNATRLTSQQLDSIIMQITQENIRNGKITPAAAAQSSGQTAQPAATQSTLPVMAQRMKNDPEIQAVLQKHPEYDRFLSGLK